LRRDIEGYFKLLKKTKEDYNIRPKNTYNIDKTGFIIDTVFYTAKVMVPRYNKGS